MEPEITECRAGASLGFYQAIRVVFVAVVLIRVGIITVDAFDLYAPPYPVRLTNGRVTNGSTSKSISTWKTGCGRISNLVVEINKTVTNKITAAEIGGFITPQEAAGVAEGYLP